MHCEMDVSLRARDSWPQMPPSPAFGSGRPLGSGGGGSWVITSMPLHNTGFLAPPAPPLPSGDEETSAVFSCHDALDSHWLKLIGPSTQ